MRGEMKGVMNEVRRNDRKVGGGMDEKRRNEGRGRWKR